jgi:hypothetical protein
LTTFQRIDESPSASPPTLHVSWLRLPILWWRGIPVTQTEDVQLTVLDTYTIEVTRRLGGLDSATFAELTGLPALVFGAIARRLDNFRLLRWTGGTLIAHSDDVSDQEPIPDTAVRHVTTFLDFVYLPDTDDLLVIEDGLSEFERAKPKVTGHAPLPQTLHGSTFQDLLSSRIAKRDVGNLPSTVVGLASSENADESITAMSGARPAPPVPVCPAIESSGSLVLDTAGPRAFIDMETPSRLSRHGNRQRAKPVRLDLSAASGLVEEWLRVARLIGEPPHRHAVIDALLDIPLTVRPLVPETTGLWRLEITGREADKLAEHGSLTRHIGLQVCEANIHVAAQVRLAPADEAAEHLFALDALIEHLLADPGRVLPALKAEQAVVEAAGGIHALRRRAWTLKHSWIVHILREREDFAYE